MDLDEENALWRRLRAFRRSGERHRHPTGLLSYTAGVHYLVEHHDLAMIVTVIALSQPRARRDPELAEFQLWELTRNGARGFLVCSRAPDGEVFRLNVSRARTRLPYLRLYVEGGVLMLPSEH